MSLVQLVKVKTVEFDSIVADLATVLQACVCQGASVGFVLPFTQACARSYWIDKIKNRLIDESIVLLCAKVHGKVVGCVMLDKDMPASQNHRADIAKLLVHPDYQRQGIARHLMIAIEQEARLYQRTLLLLDTKTGDNAESLYLSMGFVVAGTVPKFAQSTSLNGYDSTTFMYKCL